MALLAGARCGVRNDSCSRKHKYARTSHGMASESLSSGVDLFFAQEFCFFKQEHGPPRGSKQVKTDVLLRTVLGPLRGAVTLQPSCHLVLLTYLDSSPPLGQCLRTTSFEFHCQYHWQISMCNVDILKRN